MNHGLVRVLAFMLAGGCLLTVFACSNAADVEKAKEMAETLSRIEASLARLESQVVELEKLPEQLAGFEERIVAVESLGEKINKVENDALELYDDAIDQILGVRESLSKQISKILTEAAEKKMQQLAARDSSELARMLEQGGVELDTEARRMTTSGSVCQTDALVEFLAVGPGGREHESLLFIDCSPSLLNAGFLSLGLTAGKPFHIEERMPSNPPGGIPFGSEEEPLVYYPPAGPRVHVYVEWTDGDKTVMHRVEDLLIDRRTGEPMEPEGWVFLGSRFAVDEQTGDEVYVADVTKDIISIWHSHRGNAILDNPHDGGMNDDTYVPRAELLPERGTPVKIVFSLEPIDKGAGQ